MLRKLGYIDASGDPSPACAVTISPTHHFLRRSIVRRSAAQESWNMWNRNGEMTWNDVKWRDAKNHKGNGDNLVGLNSCGPSTTWRYEGPSCHGDELSGLQTSVISGESLDVNMSKLISQRKKLPAAQFKKKASSSPNPMAVSSIFTIRPFPLSLKIQSLLSVGCTVVGAGWFWLLGSMVSTWTSPKEMGKSMKIWDYVPEVDKHYPVFPNHPNFRIHG